MREIIVSELALSEVQQIADYIGAKFSINDRIKFLEQFEKTIFMIQVNPEMFPKSNSIVLVINAF